MRPISDIPDTVQVSNISAYPIELAGLYNLSLAAANEDIDMTLFDTVGGEGVAPKSRLWNAIVGALDSGQLTVDSTTPSVSITDDPDRTEFIAQSGTVEANVLRPGLPDYREDPNGPLVQSLTVGASSVFADIVFSKGVYAFGTAGPVLAADLDLVFAANGGVATDCVILSVKQDDNAVEGSASALVGGETTVRVFLTVTGAQDGLETIKVSPALSAISDVDGVVAPATGKTDNLVV